MKTNLNLGIIGNCSFSALIDRRAAVRWCCLPRFDSEPIFYDLLGNSSDSFEIRHGRFDILLDNLDSYEQHYIENTAVLVTRLKGSARRSAASWDSCGRSPARRAFASGYGLGLTTAPRRRR